MFSFFNPVKDLVKEDFKTMNNDILINSLASFDIEAEVSGRNDLCVQGRKVSGSAYKLKLGKKDGSGPLSLHHGTMLLNLELDALTKYLNPNKKKLISKGVDSAIARVLNLSELEPTINHEKYCDSLSEAFISKWKDYGPVRHRVLTVEELKKNDKIMEIYHGLSKWDWRFGETP